jgi:hypothetical protein
MAKSPPHLKLGCLEVDPRGVLTCRHHPWGPQDLHPSSQTHGPPALVEWLLRVWIPDLREARRERPGRADCGPFRAHPETRRFEIIAAAETDSPTTIQSHPKKSNAGPLLQRSDKASVRATSAWGFQARLRNLICRDFISESIRIEGVFSALRSFGIRIHEESNGPVLLPGQREIASIVKPDPIHLPIAK